MPTFRITDPTTGRTARITGETAPTEQELEQIFGASPNKSPSIGGLASNAKKNVEDIASGILNLPKTIYEFSEQENAKYSPLDPLKGAKVAKDTIQMAGGGLLKDVGDTLGISVNKDQSGKYGVKFDPQAAMTHAYEKPIDTLLNVLPLVDVAKSVKGVKAIDAVEDISKVEKALPSKVLTADEVLANAGKTEKQIQRSALTQLQDTGFTVPTRRADKLKPLEVMKELQANGHTTTNIDEFRAIADATTGDNGLITKITRNAIADLKGEINLLDGDANKVIKATSDQIKISHDIPKDIRPDIELQIQDILDTALGSSPDKYDPAKLFDVQRQLEKMAAAEDAKSTYLSKNLPAEARADVYRTASREVKSVLENAAKNQNVVGNYVTPEILSQAQQISPRLAQQLAEAAKDGSISKVRSLAAPYAKLNEMIRLTDASQISAFANASKNFNGVLTDVAGMIGGAPGRMVGGAVEDLAGGKIGRNIYNAVQDTLEASEKITSKIGKGSRSVSNAGSRAIQAAILPSGTRNNIQILDSVSRNIAR